MSDTIVPKETAVPAPAHKTRISFFSGQRGIKRRDALLAYLLILPATVIIGLFGLFPLIFSVYQSTRAGLNNVVGRPDGLGQYHRAIDNLAYLLAFWMAFIFLIFTIRTLYKAIRLSRENNENPWIWAPGGFFLGSGLTLLLGFTFAFLPGLLEVGEKMKGLAPKERQAAFFVFLGEAWNVSPVPSLFWAGILCLLIGALLFYAVRHFSAATLRDGTYTTNFTTATLLFFLAIALGWFTWTQVQLAYAEALAEGEPLDLWTQMVTISAGFILWLFSWLLWRKGSEANTSNLGWILRTVASLLLIVGGWVLIAELPAAIAAGNEEWWLGLKVTVFYVVGALPVELFLGLAIAVLLYQDIKAKGLYRMIFFLPFITPAVGSAAVFKVLFSGNPNGAMNQLVTQFGLAPMGWLNEPAGINELIANSLGITLPEWAIGPSLALVVAIIYGVWRYTGYNVVFFLAGLGNVDREMYEAASIDGASRWEQFRNITIPLVSPITYFLAIFGIIGAFKAFNTIYVLRTSAALGTMDTASLVIFDAFNRDTRYGYAAALGVILLIIILAATALFDRIAQGRIFYE